MDKHEIAIPFDVEAIHEDSQKRLLRKLNIFAKTLVARFFEIIVSIIGIISLIPLSIVIYFQNLKNGDQGPIFYTQDRIGKDGKVFKMYKFRTMAKNADEILAAMLQNEENRVEYSTYRKFRHDPRLTKFGEILREKSLDEFPQFINVLKGDMTIVGPRPYMPEEKEKMGEYYDRIVSHKPGMTGVFQISAKERVTFAERLDMDIKYHYRKSLKVDLKIAIITLLVTFVRKETYNLGEITADTAGYISRLLTLFVKRIIDIIGAIVGIIILVPLTAVVWIVNNLSGDHGPLFYSHERIGKNGKHFKMYKFRSMCMNSQEILEKLLAEDEEARKEWNDTMKLRNDPRITKIGKFLRKTSLDEFPQFINVLKGEMSLVGPRAVIDGEIDKFGIHKNTVLSVKPGVTGYWAANGRSDTSYDERVKLEKYYAENVSLWLDIKILVKTVISVIKKEGAV